MPDLQAARRRDRNWWPVYSRYEYRNRHYLYYTLDLSRYLLHVMAHRTKLTEDVALRLTRDCKLVPQQAINTRRYLIFQQVCTWARLGKWVSRKMSVSIRNRSLCVHFTFARFRNWPGWQLKVSHFSESLQFSIDLWTVEKRKSVLKNWQVYLCSTLTLTPSIL